MCVKKNILIILLILILIYFIMNKSNENIIECNNDYDCNGNKCVDNKCV